MSSTTPAPFDAQRLIELGRVAAIAAAPDGSWAAVVVDRLDAEGAKYVSDLWRVPLVGGGPAVRLTRGVWRDGAPCFRADGALGFLSNRVVGEKAEEGDDERAQVWVLPAEGGEPVPVTDEPLGVIAFEFAERGDRLVCLAPALPGEADEEQRKTHETRKKQGPSALRFRDPPVRYWDHWLPAARPHLIAFDGNGDQRRDLTPNADAELTEAELAVSPDGRRCAVTRWTLGADRLLDVGLWVVELDTGQERIFGGAGEELGAPLFSPDGALLVATHRARSVERAGPTTLRRFRLDTDDAGAPLAQAWDVWPQPEAFTPDGRTLLVTAEYRARKPVFAIDLETDEVRRLTADSAGGSHSSVLALPAGDRFIGIRSRILHPPEPFVAPLTEDATPRLLAELSGFSEAEGRQLAVVTEHNIASTDGGAVQTFVVAPRTGGPHPGLLWIHGGPMGAWADVWHWRWNALIPAAQGYAVNLPNPRGSTGFGQPWIEGIWGNVWGAQCYEDVMAVADAFEALPDVAGSRVAAMGGSFGGYMTNWLGANTDRFACLITHASVYSMSLFYGDTDFPPFWALFMGGYPYEDPEKFDRYSPSRQLSAWRSPTLIIHGEKDYRVPISQALHLFEGLHYHGVDCELLVFPDENHWILKPRNIVAWYQAVLDYLGRHAGP